MNADWVTAFFNEEGNVLVFELFQGAAVRRKGMEQKRWFLGDPIEVLVGAEETDGAYSLVEFWIGPGSGALPHTHTREDEHFYILEGEIEFSVAGKAIQAHAGDFVKAFRGEQHSFRNPGETPARLLVAITPGNFVDFFVELSTPCTECPAPPPMPEFSRVAEVAGKYGCLLASPPGA